MFFRAIRSLRIPHGMQNNFDDVCSMPTRNVIQQSTFFQTSCNFCAKHKNLRLVLAELPQKKKTRSLPPGKESKFADYQAESGDKESFYRAMNELRTKSKEQRPYEAEQFWYSDPINSLAPYLSGPLLDEEREHTFQPIEASMREATKCFIDSERDNHRILFAGKALNETFYPDNDLPEVAFIGRSNVGKSSVVSGLFMYDQIKVPVSKTAGKTRKLNFYRAGSSFTLVDLPGYGPNMPEYFHQMIYDFLKTRKNLRRTFVLIDCGVAAGAPAADFPSANDVTALQLLSQFGESCCIILTKIDACLPSQRVRALQNFQRLVSNSDALQTGTCFPQPFMVSAVTGEGMGLLQSFVTYVTGNLTYVDRRERR